MISYNDLKNNIDKVMDNVNRICNTININNKSIHIIGASKTMPSEVIDMLDDINIIKTVGENRVQELLSKYHKLRNINWDFIGQLQTNKVKFLTDKVDLIHSVDRLSLIETIDKISKNDNKITDILIEINMGAEESKGGIKPSESLSFIKSLSDYENIRIKGLMSVMPQSNENELRNYYKSLNKLYNEVNKLNGKNIDIQYLSAGMSKDYQIAIEYGANMIRLGTAIFGQRVYGGQNA